jgi:glucose-6-phosphate 1-dehydrogenase
MFANHLLQLITLTAMEAPYAFNESSVRDEKMKVLRTCVLCVTKQLWRIRSGDNMPPELLKGKN